jgi:hypothetical protein
LRKCIFSTNFLKECPLFQQFSVNLQAVITKTVKKETKYADREDNRHRPDYCQEDGRQSKMGAPPIIVMVETHRSSGRSKQIPLGVARQDWNSLARSLRGIFADET